jgi:NADPH2:quinone reductase
MPATHRAMMITRPGGPEVLQPVDLPVVEPGPGEVGVRVRACGVGATDLTMLTGAMRSLPSRLWSPVTRLRVSSRRAARA